MSEELPFRVRARIAAWLFGGFLVLLVSALYGYGKVLTLPVLGEAAGVLAVVFIVLSLLLMLRVPWLANRCGGLESMYGLHRGFGLAGYGFVLLHPLLLSAQEGWEILTMQGKNFGFRSGWTAALVLMVVLFCTFLLKTRGYAIWRRLHTLSIVAVLAAAWHVLAYQTDLPIAGKAILTGLLAVGLIVPIARHVLIDRGVLSTPFRVDAVGHPARDVVDMQLRPAGAALAIQPGQFVFARFLPGTDWSGCDHFHPFTASAVDADGSLRLSIKASGPCTGNLQHITPGTLALLQGPYGELFQNVRQDSQVWIAGGIGITPFLARVRGLDEQHVPVRLFYFFDDIRHAPYLDELEALAESKPLLTLHAAATHGTPAMMASIFDAFLPPWNDKHYVLCGSEGFGRFIRAYLKEHRVRPGRISEERFEFR